MKTGVVLEINGPIAVVLDGSGSFRTVPAVIGWCAGDVVPLAAPRRKAAWTLPLAACLAAALLGSGGFLWLDQTSLVSLDVNPSVELGLNRFERVVSVTARNDEGAELLSVANVAGKTAGEAVEELLDSGYLGPYLEESGCVSLSVQSPDAALAARLETAATGGGYQVECSRVDAATVEEAHHYGVTAGKYLALLELQAADPSLDISAYTHCGIGEIRAETERCLEDGHDQSGTAPGTETNASCNGNGYGGGNGEGYGGGHHGGNHH